MVQCSCRGIRVPFVSAIVDPGAGGTLQGRLINMAADPAKIQTGMPLKLVCHRRTGGGECGTQYMMFYFQPGSWPHEKGSLFDLNSIGLDKKSDWMSKINSDRFYGPLLFCQAVSHMFFGR